MELNKAMSFKKTNPHPTGKKIGDCVIRAIAIGDDKNWHEVYKILCAIGGAIADMPNSKPVYQSYLESYGWKKHPMPRFPNGKRYKACELVEEYKDKEVRMVIQVSKHLAAAIKGTLYDTWDCGNKSVYNFYTKPI